MSTDAVIKITGLASDGFKSEEIVKELMEIAREPLERLEYEQQVEEDKQSTLREVQTSLQELSSTSKELGFATLFEKSQTATSSESSRVSAKVTGGAAIGGYEIEVTQLASAAQRTFTYTSPASAETIAIDGVEVEVAAGETLSELADAINANSKATVYASAVGTETLVLSDRETGKSEDFIEVRSEGGSLVEEAALAREGKDAEYKIDGIAGSSASNTVTEAISGVTLTFSATTTAGAVTLDVSAPGIDTEKVMEKVEEFVTTYNSTIAKLQTEVSTKPDSSLEDRAESGTGLLFGDSELENLIGSMRSSIYTDVEGLPESMSSLASLGIGTDAKSSATSDSSLEGKLTIETATLEEALQSNPEGVRKMLEGWTTSFDTAVEAVGGPGGTIAAEITSEESESRFLGLQVDSLTETLELHQENLEKSYSELEVTLQELESQSKWLTEQFEALEKEK